MSAHRLTCAQIQGHLSAFLDGDLDARRTLFVRGHLPICPICRRACEETQRIVAAMNRLDPLNPPSALWGSIEAHLHQAKVADAKQSRFWQAMRPRPVFSVSLVLTLAGLLVLLRFPAETAPAIPMRDTRITPAGADPQEVLVESALRELERVDADYLNAIEELRALVEVERHHWSVAAAEAFGESLETIDRAVERQREVIRQASTSVDAREALHASYRREIDFLQEVVIRGEVAK